MQDRAQLIYTVTLSMGIHCPSFFVRNVSSSIALPPLAGSCLSSNELLTSTTRPACWPSKQPSTRTSFAWVPLVALMRVAWSLMLIRTSCA